MSIQRYAPTETMYPEEDLREDEAGEYCLWEDVVNELADMQAEITRQDKILEAFTEIVDAFNQGEANVSFDLEEQEEVAKVFQSKLFSMKRAADQEHLNKLSHDLAELRSSKGYY